MLEWSLNGFVHLVQTPDEVPAGTRIVVNRALDEIDKLGFRSAVVRCKEAASDGTRTLFANIKA